MTAYAASATYSDSASGTGLDIGLTISPVSYEIRIIRFEYGLVGLNFGVSGGTATLTPVTGIRYTTGTASGGTAITPSPLRQGSATASATSRYGTVSSTGTQVRVAQMTPIPWTDVPSGAGYDFPLDVTVSPGSVMMFALSSYHSTGTMQIGLTAYFEELRLAWHY